MKRRRITATFSEQMRRIYTKYVADGHPVPVELDVLYEYARRNNLWEPQPSDVRKQFRKQMATALREDYFTDESGKPVRRYHARFTKDVGADGQRVKTSLWDDIDTADRDHMEAAFQLRRKQIVGDCKQLKNDADYYNGKHSSTLPIPTLFDFRNDVEEADLPTEYDPGEYDDGHDEEPDLPLTG